MSHPIKRWLRSGLVLALSVEVVLAIGVPAPARATTSGSTQVSPSPRGAMGMAYDAASGQVVLFGGFRRRALDDTWTWDGFAWTHRTPAHSPPPMSSMGMAYDSARRQVVLFGADAETWTWDGIDWTQQTPTHSPSPRWQMAMTYDSAHRQVVLYGGADSQTHQYLKDTWTWDGTDWTQRSPTHSPGLRQLYGMAYDAARQQVVLFGGGFYYNDTWTWNGSDWTQQTPTHSPSPRCCMGMAYDAAHGQVLMFGGIYSGSTLGGTWSWDGTDWTHLTPAHSPPPDSDMGMAYDAASGQVVMFQSGTWTWDGTDWTQHPAGTIRLGLHSGPPGTVVMVSGWGFLSVERVRIVFIDSVSGRIVLRRLMTSAAGTFTTQVTIPAAANPGLQYVKARGLTSGQIARQAFTVT
jgi:hypothetical protein